MSCPRSPAIETHPRFRLTKNTLSFSCERENRTQEHLGRPCLALRHDFRGSVYWTEDYWVFDDHLDIIIHEEFTVEDLLRSKEAT